MKARRLYLVDGSGLLFRAHFAFLRNPLITKKGEVVSAVFGFASTLVRLLREQKPDLLGVAFDLGKPTFRHERFPSYKANRPPMPEELIAQGDRTRELLAAFGITVLEREGVEADDLIGTLACVGHAAGCEVTIVSADKDFMQLVRPGIKQLIPPRANEAAQWIDEDGVFAKWGVRADQMIDLLGLMGDSSDNVPGVPGVGEKTAVKLLQQYGSMDGIYAALESVAPKGVREKLEKGRESAYLSRELVTIATELAEVALLDDLTVPPPTERPSLRPILEELEFRRLLDSLALPTATTDWTANYRALSTPEELDAYLESFRRSGSRRLAFDTETDSLDARRANVVGISFAFADGDGVYLPLGHREGPNLDRAAAVERLRPVLEDPALELVGQNCKFDLHVLHGLGLEPRGPLRDTLLASYLVDPEGTHKLDALSEEILGHRMIPITDLIGEGRQQRTMDQVPVAQTAEYAAEDADCAFRLESIFRERLRATGLEAIWLEMECPLVRVLLAMEQAGIGVDVGYLRALSSQMETRLAELTREIHRAAEAEFNIAAPGQLAEVLFERLKLPRGKKTKTGYSTDQEVLEELASLHPVPRLVLEHRLLSKLKGTYIDALPGLVDEKTGRIHTTYNQTVAATGRLSSNDPNMQNIPIRSAQGREIRRAFVAAPGHRLICADYSQIELRVLAHLAEDPGLVEAFREGRDIHAATAARLFGVSPEAVDVEMRARAKTVNFGVIYGMGAPRLARELGISFLEAKRFIDEYFAKMPAVKGYLERGRVEARRQGYVTTLFGRRRIVRGLDSGDSRLRSSAERIVANTPIQGSAADLIKRAMLEVAARLRSSGLATRMLLQVHDELVLEAPVDEVARAIPLVREAMEGAAELRVPLRVDFHEGANWAEAHP